MLNRLHRILPGIRDFVVYMGMPILLLMFMHFNIEVAKQTKATNSIVASQTKILNAIRAATDDNKLTAEQKSNLIICMLQVPVEQRSDDVLQGCRKQAETTLVASASGNTSQNQSSSVGTNPSSQPTPATTTTQPNNSQPPESPQPTVLQRILDFINPFN